MLKKRPSHLTNKILFATILLLVALVLFVSWVLSSPKGLENDFSYVGLSLDDAKEKASSKGMKIRVVAGPQKQKGIFTLEYDANRINVLTLFNIVLKAQRG